MASRSRLAPQVMAYWLMSERIAAMAASFKTWGVAKLGKPWARLMAPCSLASRVIPRMTDSVKVWVRCAVRMAQGAGVTAIYPRPAYNYSMCCNSRPPART